MYLSKLKRHTVLILIKCFFVKRIIVGYCVLPYLAMADCAFDWRHALADLDYDR